MSVGIKFLYTFSVGEYDFTTPGSNVISVSSQGTGDHDKKNLTTTPLRETWRSGTSIASYVDIVLEANDITRVPDTFALLNHNLTESAVVTVQGSMTTDFAGATVHTFVWSKKHMVKLQDVGLAYNYYRFRLLDPSNPCGYLEIGRIIAGRSFTFADNEDISDDISVAPEDLAYKTPTEGFFRAFNERVKVDRVNFRFSKLSTAVGSNDNYKSLIRMLDNVGETYPFLTVLDPADQTFQIIWGVLANLPTRTFGINRFVDLSMQVQEIY